jgi:hypothetical protein
MANRKTIVEAMKWASISNGFEITPERWIESYEFYLEYGDSLTEYMAQEATCSPKHATNN